MPTILLIRHGETDYVKKKLLAGRIPGIHLNENGQRQATQLAEALRAIPIAAIYSSPLERALETANPIADGRDIQIQPVPGLMDTDIGEWQGAELKKLRKLPEWKQVQQAPSRFRFPGGDSFVEQQARLIAEVERIAHLHNPNDLVALVFHADPIKMVMAYYLGMPLDAFQRLACGAGSLSVLLLGETSAMLVQMNVRPPFSLPEFPHPQNRKKSG